jgi:hypothetical protein
MRQHKIIILGIALLLTDCVMGQTRLILGGGVTPPPKSRSTSGLFGLQAKSDRNWFIGVSRSGKENKSGLGWGLLGSVLLRSPFYELDRALPYYPLRKHIPTYLFEGVQLFPFLSYCRPFGQKNALLDWEIGVGPVFVFHEGYATSTTFAASLPNGTPFVLFQHELDRHPVGIPFLGVQMGVNYAIRVSKRSLFGIHPYGQIQVGDRSRIRYQTTPADPIHTSTGWIKNGAWSFGIQCRYERRPLR